MRIFAASKQIAPPLADSPLIFCFALLIARRTGVARGRNHPWSLSLENLRYILYFVISLADMNRKLDLKLDRPEGVFRSIRRGLSNSPCPKTTWVGCSAIVLKTETHE